MTINHHRAGQLLSAYLDGELLPRGAALVIVLLALIPFVKGTVDRLHAAEIGVDLYVREHALQMSTEPLTDRAYLGVVAGDADLVLVGEQARRGGAEK